MTAPAIATDRLRLRRWTDADRAPFAAMGGDREVMRYLGPLQTRAEADAAIDRANAHLDEHGFTFWAIERLADGAFLGFCGLKRVTIPGPLRGEVEIGWRLQRDAWGHGYAFEAARASRDFGFLYAGLPRICAFTVAANARSWGADGTDRHDAARRYWLRPSDPDRRRSGASAHHLWDGAAVTLHAGHATGPRPHVTGRSDRIRTCDPFTPSEVRYQAAPRSDRRVV